MSSVATLDPQFTGTVIVPEDAGYDEARGLFNGGIDKRPALIARCTNTADVRIALATRASTTSWSPSAAAAIRRRALVAATTGS